MAEGLLFPICGYPVIAKEPEVGAKGEVRPVPNDTHLVARAGQVWTWPQAMRKHHLGPWHTAWATPDPLEPDPGADLAAGSALESSSMYLYITALRVSALRILF